MFKSKVTTCLEESSIFSIEILGTTVCSFGSKQDNILVSVQLSCHDKATELCVDFSRLLTYISSCYWIPDNL